MSEELTRRYVYKKTFDKIMVWGKRHNIKSPNMEDNFPNTLEKFVESKGDD